MKLGRRSLFALPIVLPVAVAAAARPAFATGGRASGVGLFGNFGAGVSETTIPLGEMHARIVAASMTQFRAEWERALRKCWTIEYRREVFDPRPSDPPTRS